MSGAAPERGGSERDIAAALRLRPDPPRVMRLSRRVLIGLGVAAGLGIGGALIVALQSRSGGEGPRELYSTDRNPEADGLANLPRDYAGIPQLGPPLPGDLGRPILRAQERGQPVVPPAMPTTADPAEQRRLQEIEAARTSRLFVQVEARGAPRGAEPVGPQAVEPGALPIGQDATDRRTAFLGGQADRRTTSADRLQAPVSPFVIQAGSVIPAALLTGLRSDLPGQITAQVTANVFDSPTGRHLLIPQGARLIGAYDSRISFGQRRILLAWNRLILPSGRSIVLERMPGTDEAGYAGLEDGVDHHWGQLFLAAGLATLLNLGLELGQDDESDIARAIRESGQDTVGRAGEEIVRRQLSVPPTLTVRPGFPVRVIVHRDLVLEPYGG
ncbi:TrbI/VirB10 family protein [Roseomonas sp. F4]|uniref:TrbI/VirB10 family protein n=2 Tax=Falsiroseomonas TaxID=2870713 RepID=A0ABS6HEX9_9PROT|nr:MULTISPECIES: TrbI/VirB10 family protein [Acetobacteraceae]MBU8547306.1 TrbI/VirB10 family protein [Roseomonas oleicola]MDP3418904.1 TrbI/VirB10 family protein [Falsiroseomonas sp.]NKE45243.1 TrbI/VirB10 family protein [Falsiroseomonas frigidaquae]